MTSKAALFALLAMWGVGSTTTLPAFAEECSGDACAAESASESSSAKRGLTDKVWVKLDTGDLPGITRIFLSDGTLVQDSCWETHRLSPWEMTSDTAIKWNEDGIDVHADIVLVSTADLVLNLKLGSEIVEERYTTATVPYVCPDMPK